MNHPAFLLGILFVSTLFSCAFPEPPPPTVVDRSPGAPFEALDRPLVLATGVVGYELARFGFATAVDKAYDEDKMLGQYLTVFDWTTGTVATKTFWEGGVSWGRYEVSAGPVGGGHWFLSTGQWARLEPSSGQLVTGPLPEGKTPSKHVTSDGYALLASRPTRPYGIGNPTNLWSWNLTSAVGTGPVSLSGTMDSGNVQLVDDLVDEFDRFWINTGKGRLYRYDPRTLDLRLVHSVDKPDQWGLKLLGGDGGRVLASAYRNGLDDHVPRPVEFLVFDAASGDLEKTVALNLPDSGFVEDATVTSGKFYLLVRLTWRGGDSYPYQVWSFDPVTGDAENTGMAFQAFVSDGVFARGDQLMALSRYEKEGFLTVVHCDLVSKQVSRIEVALPQGVKGVRR